MSGGADVSYRSSACGGWEMKEWIISDTHFSHAKIIEYCNRPFRNVEQMNETIIARWKGAVKPEDVVYHLGISQLPGKKILIRGNHDKSPNVYAGCGV